MIERGQDGAAVSFIERIPPNKFPNHILIIPDGNGRWAKSFEKNPSFGHTRGAKVLTEILDNLRLLPITFITVWGFACDNWKRPPNETGALMQIFEEQINLLLPKLIRDDVRFVHLGRKDRIPDSLKDTIQKAESLTGQNSKQVFSLAIDFGGGDQLIRMIRAVRCLPQDTQITQEIIESLRDGRGEIPSADLIIRTSGENRTSDVGWLGTNAEFYSISSLLPNATIEDFMAALIDYSKRERRFGGRLE